MQMTRGPHTITLPSKKWLKSGDGNNLVLAYFEEDSPGGVSYHVGWVEQLVACCDQFGANPRLVAIMTMREVEPSTVDFPRHRGVRRHTLANLWQVKRGAGKETYIAPVWEITQKVMMCHYGNKNYYCSYE